MGIGLNNCIARILRFHNFLLGAAPGPYSPNDMRYWLDFEEYRQDIAEGIDKLEHEFVYLLNKSGIHVNTLQEAQAEIEKMAAQTQQPVIVIPPQYQ